MDNTGDFYSLNVGSIPARRTKTRSIHMWECVHCKQEFRFIAASEKANHSRWCKENPKRRDYVNALLKRNNIGLMIAAKKKNGITNQYTKAKQEGRAVPSNPRKGRTGFKGTPHKEETKEILRAKALASPHRRLKKKMIEYNGILLDSTWELELAKRLDEINVKWIRPDPIKWVDNDGNLHHYFPDFYLPEHDLYLDPKNPQAIKVQQKKIDLLLQQYNNIKILSSLEACKNFILQ